MFSLLVQTTDFGRKFLMLSIFKFVKFAIPGRKKGSGRPRKRTSHVLGVVKKHIQKHPESTAADLKTSCPELANISERTIFQALEKHLNGGLTLRPPTVRPPVHFFSRLGGPIDLQRAV
jgi:hypothetical protein